jgi:transcriptional regulator with XRE-family HTH domain
MDVHVRLGKNIRRLRKQEGFTQETLSDQTTIHRNYISDLERGHRNPSVDVLEKLAVALNVSIAKLFE